MWFDCRRPEVNLIDIPSIFLFVFRSAVNSQSGSMTGIAGVFTGQS